MARIKDDCFALWLVVLTIWGIGCRQQKNFEISMVSRRTVMLEDAVLASNTGKQLRFGYLTTDDGANFVGGWQIKAGETLSVSWMEEGQLHSSQITVVSTNVGPNGIQIEINADGTLDARPK